MVAKRVDPKTIEFTVILNGKQVASDRSVLSADEKTFIHTRNGVDANGNAVKGTVVYNRQ